MFFRIILIIQTILHVSSSEIPVAICAIDKPFEKSDNTCGDFNDICVKKDDLQCSNFQAACKQCPPTNYTVYMLEHLKDLIKLTNTKMSDFKNQIADSRKKIKLLTDIIIFLVVLFILCVIILLIPMPNGKYDSIVHYLISIRKSKSKKGNTVEENQNLISNQETIYSKERFDTIINENNLLLKEMKEAKNENVASAKLRFRIANQFDETELFVSKFDNVIKLKKSICDRNMNMNDYKRMTMKYKGATLDNNQLLLSSIDSTNIPIFCEFDINVDIDSMIVIKLKCDNIYLEMLQIWKHQTIKDLKIIISKLNKTNYKDLLIFHKCKELDDDDKTIDDYKIEDNDWIKVGNKFEEMQNISMKSIFTDRETISITISNFETVSDIINKSIKEVQPKMVTNHFALFLNNKLLENEKFIYEYNIDCKSLVEFCYFKSLNENDDVSKLNDFGHIQLFKAKNKIFDRPILLKAYNEKYMLKSHDNVLSRILGEDLQMFQITKYHPRFVQLFGIYMDDEWVYIGMENSTKIPMVSFLLNNNEIPRYEESKWAYQMLEGLTHLHNHNIIMKDMNPMDIWIDGNHDIKLPSLNKTEYLKHLNDDEYKHKDGILRYVAPEILEIKPYEASVDVWSLGVIMIEVVTRGKIFPELSESEVVQKIKESRTIEYGKTNKPEDLIDFINCCVKGDPKERSTIDQLMKHKFIKKYLLFSDFI